MDSESRKRLDSPEPKRLKTLASNVAYPGGNTLLHQFVLDRSETNDPGSENLVNAVLLTMSDFPADVVNALNSDGYGALHVAVKKKNILMVKKMLSCLANVDVNKVCLPMDVNARDRWSTDLRYAAKYGSLPAILSCLSKGIRCFPTLNGDTKTALCIAAESADLEMMKLLVEKGASVNPEYVWDTPLCCAARSGNLAAVQFLLSSGAENTGVLCFEARSGNLSSVQILVDSGADVNGTAIVDINISHGLTPLYYAAISGSLATVEFLVSSGADVNKAAEENKTPLHAAACSGSRKMLEFAVGNLADVNARDGHNKTPDGNYSEIAAFLLDRGADLDAVDLFGNTPLHHAVKCRNLETAKLLLDRGADLYAINEYGRTPLHSAAFYGNLEMTTILLDRGAAAFHANNQGMTPLHFAAYRGHTDVIRALLDRGADANAEDKYGLTPLDLASGKQSCMDALQNVG